MKFSTTQIKTIKNSIKVAKSVKNSYIGLTENTVTIVNTKFQSVSTLSSTETSSIYLIKNATYFYNSDLDKVLKVFKKNVTVTIDNNVAIFSDESGTNISIKVAHILPPIINVDEQIASYQITDSSKLINAINNLSTSFSDDDTKMILCGINFQNIDNGLILAATNGHILKTETIDTNNLSTINKTYYGKELNIAIKLLEKNSSSELIFTDNNLIIKTDKVSIIVETIEGNYPNYQMLIPKTYSGKIEFDNKALLESLEKFDRKSHVTLTITNDNVSITDGNLVINSHKPLSVSESTFTFTANIHYLKSVMGSIDAPFMYNNDASQMVLQNDYKLALMMPIKLRR
jgi:DNA polymerase-3 subunit beta